MLLSLMEHQRQQRMRRLLLAALTVNLLSATDVPAFVIITLKLPQLVIHYHVCILKPRAGLPAPRLHCAFFKDKRMTSENVQMEVLVFSL